MKYTLIILFIVVLTSCYYDSEEKLYPAVLENTCDTTNVSYSKDIKPMIIGNCYDCHDNEHAAYYGGNIPLEDYDDVKSSVDDGSFFGSIAYDGNYVPMPEDYQLDSCMMKKVKAWMNNGALNN